MITHKCSQILMRNRDQLYDSNFPFYEVTFCKGLWVEFLNGVYKGDIIFCKYCGQKLDVNIIIK